MYKKNPKTLIPRNADIEFPIITKDSIIYVHARAQRMAFETPIFHG